MAIRIFIENPPPFKRKRRKIGDNRRIVDGHMEEGLEAVHFYLDAGLHPAGFHHSDIDPVESRKLRGDVPLERFPTFEYARFLKARMPDFAGLWIPHHVAVYESPADQLSSFDTLVASGIHDVVLVGLPSDKPAAGMSYRASVSEVLAYLAERHDKFGFTLGAIGIHLRQDEPQRIAAKYRAAGGRLRIMGQFLDEADRMVVFLERLAAHFEEEGLDLDRLEYNVGLAFFGLRNHAFYARLLQKRALECGQRFAGLKSRQQRIDESVRMNVEFAEQILEAGRRNGVDIGFSIQPLIERTIDCRLHPAVHAAVDLVKRLERLDQ